MTVSGDTPSASAVSCTLRPPKNRISMTLLFRSSCFASSTSASIECDEVAAWFVRDRHVVDERDLHPAAAPLQVLLRTREVAEDAPHQPCGHGEEVRAILPVHAARFDQAQVRFVHECGGLQAVARPFAGHTGLGDPVQLGRGRSGSVGRAPCRRPGPRRRGVW